MKALRTEPGGRPSAPRLPLALHEMRPPVHHALPSPPEPAAGQALRPVLLSVPHAFAAKMRNARLARQFPNLTMAPNLTMDDPDCRHRSWQVRPYHAQPKGPRWEHLARSARAGCMHQAWRTAVRARSQPARGLQAGYMRCGRNVLGSYLLIPLRGCVHRHAGRIAWGKVGNHRLTRPQRNPRATLHRQPPDRPR